MTAPLPETMSPREKVDVRSIALAAMNEMRRSGESYEMCARWISERVNADLASSGDHAELARLADYCRTLVNPGDLIVGPNMMRHALEQSADALEALIAENAALREHIEANKDAHWSAAKAHIRANRRATEAERKLAEAEAWIAKQDCECDPAWSSRQCSRCTFLSSQEAA